MDQADPSYFRMWKRLIIWTTLRKLFPMRNHFPDGNGPSALMPRLHVVKLREAAASRGDTSDYKIVKRTGISQAAISRLVNQKVEPTVSTLLRLKEHYGLGVEDMIQMIRMADAA